MFFTWVQLYRWRWCQISFSSNGVENNNNNSNIQSSINKFKALFVYFFCWFYHSLRLVGPLTAILHFLKKNSLCFIVSKHFCYQVLFLISMCLQIQCTLLLFYRFLNKIFNILCILQLVFLIYHELAPISAKNILWD